MSLVSKIVSLTPEENTERVINLNPIIAYSILTLLLFYTTKSFDTPSNFIFLTPLIFNIKNDLLLKFIVKLMYLNSFVKFTF
jgi:hypothetical protein